MTLSWHWTSECKECMRKRYRDTSKRDYKQPKNEWEEYVINALHNEGIPALPGKAIRTSKTWSDIVAFGCVEIEVKSSSLTQKNKWSPSYKFTFTPSQIKRGLVADCVILICSDVGSIHLFTADNPVFYIDGKLKGTITYTPDSKWNWGDDKGRAVMTKAMMDEAANNWQVIRDVFYQYCDLLVQSCNLEEAVQS